MMQWIKRIFTRKRVLVCGGEGSVIATDSLGREVAQIWFRRPTSNEILSFVYEEQSLLGTQTKLREIEAEPETKRIGKMHDILTNDLWLPWSKKVFVRATGYVVDDTAIESLPGSDQFDALAKYYAHNLVDMCAVAFQRGGVVKKKD